jgi:hypothetical protein
MSDWVGIGIIAGVLLLGLYGLARLTKPYEISHEEFEKRAHESPSLLSAGFTGLQKILDPAAKKAVEAQEDLKQGRYDKKDNSGDKPEAGHPDVDQEAKTS